MKKAKKYWLYCCNFILISLVVLNICSYEVNKDKVVNVFEYNNKKFVSYLLIDKKNDVIEDNKPYNVIETLVGNLAGYGPDCYGCTSMHTASGMYIGNGNIYYNDNTYGKVRIVAGDYAYPFGTIVKISNVSIYNEPFYAIVLDRGQDIGKGKRFLFDLLFNSEKDAYSLGNAGNIKFEIVRLGY